VSQDNSRIPVLAGVAVAGTGLAHFVAPGLFEGITTSAFPRDTARHLKINGACETAIGVGLVVPQTRKLAILGAVGYVGYLAVNVIRNR
jgi:uncharacterized membrane protein